MIAKNRFEYQLYVVDLIKLKIASQRYRINNKPHFSLLLYITRVQIVVQAKNIEQKIQADKNTNFRQQTHLKTIRYDKNISELAQQMPHQQIFQGSIVGYETKIVLNSQGITIFLFNPLRRRWYQAKIPNIYQGKSKEIQDVFVNLDQFYTYITLFSQDPDRVSINDQGKIRVAYQFDKSKNKKPPVVFITTEILLTGHQLATEKKIQDDMEEMRRENRRIQSGIDELTHKNQSISSTILELKEMLARSQKRYREQSSSQEEEQYRKKDKKKKKKKYSVISGGKTGMKELKETVGELAGELNLFKAQIQSKNHHYQPKINQQPYFDPLCQQNVYGKFMRITVDQNNRFLSKQFRVQGNKITKIRGYGRFQILSKQVIPEHGKHYFIMYIQKISYMLFSLGIVSQKRRNYQNSHLSPQLISYFAKTGGIWEKGDTRIGGPKIPNNVEIRISVDMSKYTVTWFMDRKQIASTKISQKLRKERLVAFIQFNYEGDVVYWNERGPEEVKKI